MTVSYGKPFIAHGMRWIPHGTVSRMAKWPARHGIPHDTVSRAAEHPKRRSNAPNTVSCTARHLKRHDRPLHSTVRIRWNTCSVSPS
jgi:hypothetical protein